MYAGFGKQKWQGDAAIDRKIPPAWGPHMRNYPLRDWVRDIAELCTLSDYQPHQQGIAIKKRLQGSAALFADQYTHEQLIAGVVDPATGQNVDAVTMIVRDMVRYFAPRVEEDQQIADLELENIYRQRDEPIEEYIRRYEKIHCLAEGQWIARISPSPAAPREEHDHSRQ